VAFAREGGCLSEAQSGFCRALSVQRGVVMSDFLNSFDRESFEVEESCGTEEGTVGSAGSTHRRELM
jgi:hypothetical protein